MRQGIGAACASPEPPEPTVSPPPTCVSVMRSTGLDGSNFQSAGHRCRRGCIHASSRRRSPDHARCLPSRSGALGLFDHLRTALVEDLSREKLVRYAFEALSADVAKPTVGTKALAESR
jgi:hypothetical protein